MRPYRRLSSGDATSRGGDRGPASLRPHRAPQLYNTETGIARDGDLNAKGGVRLPDLAVGRAQFIASDLETSTVGIPSLAPHSGSTVDLACEPESGSESDEPRFKNHGEYVSAFTQQVNRLRQQGFLLEADADALKLQAAESDVGKPGTCQELGSARTFFPA